MPGDASKPRLAARGVLLRREAEPGGELTAVLELVCIGDARNDRRSADRPDSAQLPDTLGALVLARVLLELPLVLTDAFIERVHMREQIAQPTLCHPWQRHQLYRVSVLGKAPCPLVRSGTGLQSDHARRQLRHDRCQARPAHRLRNTTTPRPSTACSENTFFAKSIPQVVTLLKRLPLFVGRLEMHTHLNLGTHVPRRDGEVPYIR